MDKQNFKKFTCNLRNLNTSECTTVGYEFWARGIIDTFFCEDSEENTITIKENYIQTLIVSHHVIFFW